MYRKRKLFKNFPKVEVLIYFFTTNIVAFKNYHLFFKKKWKMMYYIIKIISLGNV